ncbi:hypothetical protein ACFLRQ_03345 [Bacteroidota bacterium]
MVIRRKHKIGVAIDPTTHKATYTPEPNWNGIENIIFTATDEGGLTAKDTAKVEVLAVNDAPVFDDSNYGNQSTTKEKPFKIPLDKFSDVDNTLAELIFTFANLTNATYAVVGDSIEITPNAEYVGTMTGVQVTATDPGALSDISDVFDIEVTPPLMTSLTINFKKIRDGSNFTDGVNTVYFTEKDNPSNVYSAVANASGQATLDIPRNKNFDVSTTATTSIDTDAAYETEMTALYVDDVWTEQATYSEKGITEKMPYTSSGESQLIDIIKIHGSEVTNTVWTGIYMSSRASEPDGIRALAPSDWTTTKIWFDENSGHTPTAQELQWAQEVIDNYKTVYNVPLELTIVQGTTAPTDTYFRINISSGVANPNNGTTVDELTHYIIGGVAQLPLNSSEQDLKMELRQAIGAVMDFLGDDPAMTYTSSPRDLNSLGEFMHSVQYTFKPKDTEDNPATL